MINKELQKIIKRNRKEKKYKGRERIAGGGQGRRQERKHANHELPRSQKTTNFHHQGQDWGILYCAEGESVFIFRGRVGHELLGMRLVCAAARSKHRRYGNRLVLYPIYCMPGVERGKCGVLRRVATPDSTILPGCHCEKFSLLKEYYLTHKHGFPHNSATHCVLTSTYYSIHL